MIRRPTRKPLSSNADHYPPDGKLRVYRSRTGGNEWEALTEGLPQRDGGRLARFMWHILGMTGGHVYASADAGDSWVPIVRDLPAVLSVAVQTLP